MLGPPDRATPAALVASVDRLTRRTLDTIRAVRPGGMRLAMSRPQPPPLNGLGAHRDRGPDMVSLAVSGDPCPAELLRFVTTAAQALAPFSHLRHAPLPV